MIFRYHDREKPHSTDLDLPGVVSLAIACTATLALVSGLGPEGVPLPLSVSLGGIALVATAWFIRNEMRASNPILPPNLMMKRAIGPSLVANFVLGICFLSLDTYVPLYVQGAHGGGAGAAAWVVTPVMLTWALVGVLAAPAIVRLGFRKTAIIGCILMNISLAGLLVCAIIECPRWTLTAVLALSGFGFGPASMSYLLAAQDAVAWQQRGIITSGIQFFRTIGGAIGIGLLGMLFNILIRPELSRLHALGINPADLMDAAHARQARPRRPAHRQRHDRQRPDLGLRCDACLCNSANDRDAVHVGEKGVACDQPVGSDGGDRGMIAGIRQFAHSRGTSKVLDPAPDCASNSAKNGAHRVGELSSYSAASSSTFSVRAPHHFALLSCTICLMPHSSPDLRQSTMFLEETSSSHKYAKT